MQGKIVKGIAGFYYVYAEDGNTYECKAKGIFRKQNIKPLVGDDVELERLEGQDLKGNIISLLPRKSQLIRPAVANIDQAMVIFAITKPEPNLNLLDRFLIMMQQQNLTTTICFSKSDIATEAEKENLRQAYEACGCKVLFISSHKEEGVEEVKALLEGKTTTLAGPSGVGKSTLINYLCPNADMEVGEISKKIARGKNTTRHTQIFAINPQSFILDTPGFSSLNLFELEKEELHFYYPEFEQYESECRFRGCAHISEPDCGVKKARAEGKISEIRYHNYELLYEELKNQRKY
jgi:ribosome biogenesis GTPase